jgi:hypothetical protein
MFRGCVAMMADSTGRIDRVLRELRFLGAEIVNRDFGYAAEAAIFEPGAAASRIDAIAELLAEPLPVDYSYFLSQCAGFVGMDFHNGYVIHTPEEVMRRFRESWVPKRLMTAVGPAPVLPVGADGGGNVFLLQPRPRQVVLRWDHEIGGSGDAVPATHPCLRPISDSFVSFLERIRDDWSHFLGPDRSSWTYIT